jgi:hypothetical protein
VAHNPKRRAFFGRTERLGGLVSVPAVVKVSYLIVFLLSMWQEGRCYSKGLELVSPDSQNAWYSFLFFSSVHLYFKVSS